MEIGNQQPFGWIIVIIFILLLATIYLLGFRIDSKPDKTIVKLLFIVLMVIISFIETMMLLIGPPLIFLLQ